MYDIYRGPNHEEISIEEQLRIAIDTSSLMPANSATPFYWQAGIRPDLRYGGNCVDQAGVFMDLCPFPTCLLSGSELFYPHYAVAVDGSFFDPYWGQQLIGRSAEIVPSYAQIYTLSPRWMDGYWRVGYNFSPYYMGNHEGRNRVINVDHFRESTRGIADSQLYVARKFDRRMNSFEYRYVGDDGQSDVKLEYFFKEGSFRPMIRNIQREGFCPEEELEYRAYEIEQLYRITLGELKEYFDYAAELSGLRRG